MTRHFNQDPTEFFTVVGAPYIREHHREEHFANEHQTDDQRPRRFEIGVASVFAVLGVVTLGVSLFASNGAAKLLEVACYTMR